MAVKLVVFDCDRTLWDHANVSELTLPFRKIDEETVADAAGTRVRLFPGARDVLDALRGRGILISIASWNRPEPVAAVLEALGLSGYFTRPKVEFHPYKEKTIAALLDELRAEGHALQPDEVLFVDDRAVHLDRVRRMVGPVRTLQPGATLTDLRDVLAHLE
ncbi:MAG TPA: magnesium-dependent phosphatase-1 [bacterium]|nr:magnesium-dependent phosphatase-1 [bacterium]